MARAKRHFIPGYIWHITHKCHKREFLLKFSKDRHRYLQLRRSHKGWVEEHLGDGAKERQDEWRVSAAGEPRSHKVLLEAENEDIDLKNTFFWDVKDE